MVGILPIGNALKKRDIISGMCCFFQCQRDIVDRTLSLVLRQG